jgi:hypothetical protein
MLKFQNLMTFAGVLSFAVALFQAIIGFSPSLSQYFGAPEALIVNVYALVIVSLAIAGIIAVFGLYAISGAGHIRTLPWLKPVLTVISIIYILRGLLVVPEFLVVIGVLDVSIPVAPRFVLFSLGSLFIGLIYLAGTIGGWNKFHSTEDISAQPSS